MSDLTKQILIKTKKRLQSQGWTQHRMIDYEGKCCLYGGLLRVIEKEFPSLGTGFDYLDKRDAVLPVCLKALRVAIWGEKFADSTSCSIIPWNDVAGRKKEEVLAVLDKAIGG